MIFTLFGSNNTTLTESTSHVYVLRRFYLQIFVAVLDVLAGWLKWLLGNKIVHSNQSVISVNRNWVVNRCDTSPLTHLLSLFERLTASGNGIHTVVTWIIVLLFSNSSWWIKFLKFVCSGFCLHINFDFLFETLFFIALLWLLHYRFPWLGVPNIFL